MSTSRLSSSGIFLLMALNYILIVTGNAATIPYYNGLDNQTSLDGDFFKYESGTGNFGVNNNKLEFTTTSNYVGVREFKLGLNLNRSFTVNILGYIDLSQDYNIAATPTNANRSEVAAGITFAKEKYVTGLDNYQNRDVIKIKRSSRDGIVVNYVTDAFYQNGASNEKYFASSSPLLINAPVNLQAVYDANTLTLSTFWKNSSDITYQFLNTYNISSEWGMTQTDSMTLIVFGLASPTNTTPQTNLNVPSGAVYVRNLNIVPEPSALSLLTVGLGVILRRRRRTV